ncbi:MAG: hypothetical protein HOH66_17560 [Rhodospirillaceae bacterium]|jgi:hypothetical protein|nr:hypothetical protein [Rhodospirillaceae bacterium]MBT6119672.1 hypothetical protein [Rhodospirillaceae bacterium]
MIGRWTRAFAGALALVAAPALALAEDLPISDFYGHYVGSAMSKTEDSRYLGFEMRDLDVIIEGAEKDGFVLSWTTIRRRDGDQGPKRTTRTMFFVPGMAPNVYGPEAQGDPAKGEEVSWTRIDDDTLFTYLMAVNDRGDYELQIYARSLTKGGMALEFGRFRDGERVRKVRGKLKRVED